MLGTSQTTIATSLLLAASLSACFAAPRDALKQDGPREPNVERVGETQFGARAAGTALVGSVGMDGVFTEVCTATMLSANAVSALELPATYPNESWYLTAGHCVGGVLQLSPAEGGDSIQYPVLEQRRAASYRADAIASTGQFIFDDNGPEGFAAHDLAVVRVPYVVDEKALGQTFAGFDLANACVGPGMELGFPSTPSGQYVYRTFATKDGLLPTCDDLAYTVTLANASFCGGESGAPLIIEQTIYAILSTSTRAASGNCGNEGWFSAAHATRSISWQVL